MISSRERSKLWVQQEATGNCAGLCQHLWTIWHLDDCPAGLDYMLLHLGVTFGAQQAREWVVLCTKDMPSPLSNLHEISLDQSELIIRRIELIWRRRLRSTPGWETFRSQWVNRCNRVVKRAIDLIEENRNEKTRSDLRPELADVMLDAAPCTSRRDWDQAG